MNLLISSHKYDDKMTDMECAWYTIYEYFDTESKKVCELRVGTGWGETSNVEFSTEWTPEYIEMLKAARRAAHENQIDYLINRYAKEIAEYNELRTPQKKGQVVEIISGKHKGKVGTVSWVGQNKFAHMFDKYNKRYLSAYASAILAVAAQRPYANVKFELVRVIPSDGSAPFYVDTKHAVVTEGFEPAVLTREQASAFIGWDENAWKSIHDGYDYINYVKIA